jgi:hypothetical protein
MFTIVIQRFVQRLSALALVVAFAGGMSVAALVAYFAPDLVEYFVRSPRSTAAEFDPVVPIVPLPRWP